DEDSYFGQYTVLHMTVNNIGDEPAEFEDIFEATELTDDVVDDGVEGGSMWEDVRLEEYPGEGGGGEEVCGSAFYDGEEEVGYEGVEGGCMWEDVMLEVSRGEVGVGEEVSGTLFYDVEEDDKYELFVNAGLSSTSNKVSFKFDNDEIE